MMETTVMKELMRSNDLVLLSYIEAQLNDAGVAYIVADEHTSNIEGSIGALPRRVLVDDGDFEVAHSILLAAGTDTTDGAATDKDD
jgi:hypothetical protein